MIQWQIPKWFQRLRNDVRDSGVTLTNHKVDEPISITDGVELMPSNCGTCGHWNMFVDNLGECRRYAPSGAVEQPWPVTPRHAWCGDFMELRMVHA